MIQQLFVLGAEAGGDSLLPPFLVPELQVLIWTVIVFFLLLAVLTKFAWGPLMKALKEREDGIQKKIDDAAARFKEAEEKVADYERKISAAKEEATAIIEEGKRDAQKIYDERLAAAQNDMQTERDRSLREIQLAKDQAIEELRDRLVDFTAEMASQVIEREVKPEDHRRLIEQAIGNIAKDVEASAAKEG